MCPKCGLPAEAHLERKKYKFIIYTCPKCRSNVACYNNKLDIISDKLLGELIHTRKLRCCGDVLFGKREPVPLGGIKGPAEITQDQIADLKILLATENNFDKIISKL